MAALGNVSVTSAAIIEAQPDHRPQRRVDRVSGYVQGPQGLKGDRPGPMGATGERGTDGATIHAVKEPAASRPRQSKGDYAINNQ